MGRYDNALYDFLSDNERFADLFNGAVFQGREVLKADALEEASERYVTERQEQGQEKENIIRRQTDAAKQQEAAANYYRDLKKCLRTGTGFAVVAIENQSTVDYTMPLRIMRYDCLDYEKQARAVTGRKDRLNPVYTICLYHGTRPWKGPRNLRDMMDFGGDTELREALFHDYPMTLVDVNDLQNPALFKTELRLLLETLAVRGDGEAMKRLFEQEEFANVSVETARVIAGMTDNKELVEKLETSSGKEAVNMCKAYEEQKRYWTKKGERKGERRGERRGKRNGIKIGEKIGQKIGMVSILHNLVTSGDVTLERAAERAGMTVEELQAAFEEYKPAVE